MEKNIHNTTRLGNLDTIKLILTLLIILFHIQFLKGGDEHYRYMFYFIKNLGDCVVPAFAIISGFLYWRSITCIDNLKKKAKKRIFIIFIPYLLWNVINVVMRDWGVKINFWHDIILGNASPHFWYLFMLMFWVVFSPVLYFCYKNKKLFLLFVIIQIIYLILKGNTIYHSRVIYIEYTWAGFLGYMQPNLIEKYTNWKNENAKKILGIISLGIYILSYLIYSKVIIPQAIIVWTYGLRAVVLLIAMFSLIKCKKQTRLEKYAFWMFATHFWLDVHVMKYIFTLIHNPILYQLVTWAIVCIIGFISAFIFDKTMPTIYSILVGKR